MKFSNLIKLPSFEGLSIILKICIFERLFGLLAFKLGFMAFRGLNASLGHILLGTHPIYPIKEMVFGPVL
jgi:hypothetical protein